MKKVAGGGVWWEWPLQDVGEQLRYRGQFRKGFIDPSFSILVFLLISRESTGGSKILYIVLALFLYALNKLRGQVGEEVRLNRTPPVAELKP